MNKRQFNKLVKNMIDSYFPRRQSEYIEIEGHSGNYTAWVSVIKGYGNFSNLMVTTIRGYADLEVITYDIQSATYEGNKNYHTVNKYSYM